MLNVAAFDVIFSSDIMSQSNSKFLYQVFDSGDVSLIGKLIILDFLLDIILSRLDGRLQGFEFIIDLRGLFADVLLHVLNKAWPFVASLTWLNVRCKVEHIASFVKESKTAPDDLLLVVQDASLFVLQINFVVHNFLVRLGNNRNQEVKKNDENEHLIQNPEEVDGVDHEDSGAALEVGCSCSDVSKDFVSLNIVIVKINKVVWVGAFWNNRSVISNDTAPEQVRWILDITNGIFPSLHPDLEVGVSSWITSPFTSILVFHTVAWPKNFGVNSKRSDPDIHKYREVNHINKSLNDKLNLLAELWIDSQVKEYLDEDLDQNQNIETDCNQEYVGNLDIF